MLAIRELDQLISKTDLSPSCKQALREVRKAIITGRAGNATVGEADWSISLVSRGGSDLRFKFSMKKVS